MNTKRLAVCVLTGAMLAPIVGFAADTDADRDHPGHFIKDSAITTAIKTKLAADHISSLTRIKVDTDMDGVVWLSGVAKTREGANRAAEIARTTDGVVRVKNDIVVNPDMQ
jgi:hyperosmotically inducible periplasmic protein